MMGHSYWRYLYDDTDSKTAPRMTWALIRRVMGYARPYWGQTALVLILLLISTGIGLAAPLIIRDLLDNALPNANLNRLNLLAFGLLAIPFVTALVSIWQRWLNAQIGEGIIFDLRVALYRHMQQMSLRFFTHTRLGELISRLNDDVVNAQNAISSSIVEIITNFLRVVATLAIMLTLEWRLTLIGLLVLPLFIWFSNRVGQRLRAVVREAMEVNADMNARMNETLNISGSLLVKLFGRREDEIRQFSTDAASVRDIGIRRAVMGVQLFAWIGQVAAIGSAVIYWVGGYLVIRGDISLGTIVAFGTYLAQLYGPLQSLATAPTVFSSSVVSFERVFEIIDLPPDIIEKPDAVKKDTVRGEIRFDNVQFDYNALEGGLLRSVKRIGEEGEYRAPNTNANGTEKPASAPAEAGDAPRHQAREQALNGLDFTIAPGALVALVGPSGAGKTTLTYLIPRLYDTTSGRILLDGVDLRDWSLDNLAEHIGMVTQETYLFHDSLRNNLLYAKHDATQAELDAAARAANIYDFIMGLPKGYDTVAGERGYRLSGGEKQRLALARVLLKNPRILVLDEATSHLDSESEALIQEALSRVMVGRTSIVIAHRLSTVRAADEILVMDRGQIVERGNHEALLALGGLYAHLYATQFERYPDAIGA
ncbi:MAG: ABC transporter ATP-binding protein [Phototrophicaceae bacterium]